MCDNETKSVHIDTLPYEPPEVGLSTIDELANLPVYESKATPEQKVQNLKIMYGQVKMIKEQSGWGMTTDKTVIRCPDCDHKVKVIYAYRCLYCGIWFCEICAQIHFVMRKAN
jgi:hypothetical protein